VIRLGLIVIVLAICLTIVGAELYGAAWLAAHGMALAVRHPLVTVVVALASLPVNMTIASEARQKRATWRTGFFKGVRHG